MICESNLTKNTICAVLVAYYPTAEMLDQTIQALQGQVGKIVVVDNSPAGKDYTVRQFSAVSVEKIFLGENRGIGAGHNIGIGWAKEHGFSHVLLIDQDSVATEGMVSKLLYTERLLLSIGEPIGAVGPLHIDKRTNRPLPFIRSSNRVKKIYQPLADENYCITDFLISSGSLIRISVFDHVGMMEEALFIDCVDIEWGFRSLSKGYECYGCFDAKMLHAIGNDPLLLFQKKITMHDPLRHYYFFRNLSFLLKRPYVKRTWKIEAAIKAFLQFCIFSTIAPQRSKHFKFIMKGAWHGIIGQLGKFNG